MMRGGGSLPRGDKMAIVCPECENPLVVDTEAVEEGEVVLCDECGAELEIASLEPLELTLVDDSGYVEEEDIRRTDEDDE